MTNHCPPLDTTWPIIIHLLIPHDQSLSTSWYHFTNHCPPLNTTSRLWFWHVLLIEHWDCSDSFIYENYNSFWNNNSESCNIGREPDDPIVDDGDGRAAAPSDVAVDSDARRRHSSVRRSTTISTRRRHCYYKIRAVESKLHRVLRVCDGRCRLLRRPDGSDEDWTEGCRGLLGYFLWCRNQTSHLCCNLYKWIKLCSFLLSELTLTLLSKHHFNFQFIFSCQPQVGKHLSISN